ncbi:hypothetical protein HRW12_00030 [Streptomyces lunaelactis]|uniref:hypothetical protein n=1 Tax=Streptomyces lunaelactis TaxID=1535768 RepID=UPI00158552EE|nr:hypothetical protein [Streptomyces lunaelactis]NUK32184.1 hypothetical protein [Streptomyces lunaelactis]NUK44959.1 hypothetical protein [Streptomyces lunaelactis]
MNLAALPDHNRINDPLWQKLFYRYRHVITPLRRNGWSTDIELDGLIRADLGDGTELLIASNHPLPVDPADVKGWTVVRQAISNPDQHTALYDSTPDGPQSHHGTSLTPMFTRIDALDACRTPDRLWVSSSAVTPHGLVHSQRGPLEGPGGALARFFDWSRHLVGEGWRLAMAAEQDKVHEPLAIYERDRYVVLLRLTPHHD